MRILFFLLAAAVLLFAASFAHAQQPRCGPTVELERSLRDRFGEAVAWVGRDAAGPVVMTMNPGTGSWTVYSRRGEISCIVGAGEKGQMVDLPKPGAKT